MKKDKKFRQQKKTSGWIQSLVTFLFIVIPALFMWVFLSQDFVSHPPLNTWELWLAALGFVFYSILLSIFLVWIKLIWIDTVNFLIPIAIVLMVILLTHYLPTWVRALISISMIFVAFPVNMCTTRIIENKTK